MKLRAFLQIEEIKLSKAYHFKVGGNNSFFKHIEIDKLSYSNFQELLKVLLKDQKASQTLWVQSQLLPNVFPLLRSYVEGKNWEHAGPKLFVVSALRFRTITYGTKTSVCSKTALFSLFSQASLAAVLVDCQA